QAGEDGSNLFPSADLFSDIRFLKKELEKGRAAAVAQLDQGFFGKKADFSHAVPARSLTPYYGKFATFAGDLRKWLAAKSQVLLWCHNKGERERLSELLRQEEIPPKDTPGLSLVLGEVEQGFVLEDAGLVILPDHDLFRRYRAKRHKRSRAVSGGKPIVSLSEISIGDWTVHLDSGICLYRGLTPLTVDNVTRDYIQLEFADSEKIYLPTDQIGLIQRYIGSEGSPVLTKLGGEQWT